MAIVTMDLGADTKRIIDAVCEAHGYTGPAAEKPAAARQYVIDWIEGIVLGVERARLAQQQPAEPAPVSIT